MEAGAGESSGLCQFSVILLRRGCLLFPDTIHPHPSPVLYSLCPLPAPFPARTPAPAPPALRPLPRPHSGPFPAGTQALAPFLPAPFLAAPGQSAS